MTALDRRIALPKDMAADVSKSEPYRRRFSALKNDGEEVRKVWRLIDDAQVRDRAWWLYSEDAEELKRMRNYSAPIINNTILDVARTLAGGIYSGLTPPSKEWYRIRPASDYLEDDREAEDYLNRLSAKSRNIIARTNFYADAYSCYWDASFFGITAMLMEDDDNRIINYMRLPPGSYWPATDRSGKINTLYRRYAMTIEQMAEKFGYGSLSENLQIALEDSGRYDDSVIVIQAIQPVRKNDRSAPDWATYESVYIEEKPGDPDHILMRAYYRVKPFAVFRWTTDGVNPYAKRWPGLDALGDSQALNLLESDKLHAIENAVKPPLAADSRLRGKIEGGYPLPGKVVWTEGAPADAIIPIIKAQANVTEVRNEIAGCELRIQRAFYNHYFMAMLGEKKDMTAAEANYRAEEKASIIGATVEQFTGEFLPDVIGRTVDAIYFHDLAPPPPESLQGMEARFEYIGNLTISAQLLESAKIDSVILFVAQLAEGGQAEGWDNIDIDQAINIKAKALGVDPDVVRSFDVVQNIRAQRQQANAQMQQMAALREGAATAKDFGAANVSDDSMLGAMMGGGQRDQV